MGSSPFLLLLLGIAAGFVASTPLGPINTIVAGKVFRDEVSHLPEFLSGVILVDASFALLAVMGYNALLSNMANNTYVVVVGSLFIMLLGVLGLRSMSHKTDVLNSPTKKESSSTSGPTSQFLKGILVCGANPGFLIYWMWVSNSMGDYGIVVSQWATVLFIGGVIAGNLAWFLLFLYILKASNRRLRTRPIWYINLAISVLLIVFGAYTFFDHFIG